MRKRGSKARRRNPVARFAGRFNRAQAFRDRTKYRRHPKHRNRDPRPVGIAASDERPGIAA